MAYIEGFVAAVPAANKDAYIKHATDALPVFKEFGVTRMVETWGDDVPDGKVTDFKGAVQARDDEVVVFSWFEYPDKATRDAASQTIMADPRMEAMSKDMPFDGKRMIFGGFDSFVDDVPDGKVTDYRRAVKAEDGEAVVSSFVEWPSMAVRDEAWTKIMDDERMKPDPNGMPFDGKRMIYGGFSPIVDG